MLSSHGKRLKIGSFLSPDERVEVANALQDALTKLHDRNICANKSRKTCDSPAKTRLFWERCRAQNTRPRSNSNPFSGRPGKMGLARDGNQAVITAPACVAQRFASQTSITA